jgi:hypothetical protein
MARDGGEVIVIQEAASSRVTSMLSNSGSAHHHSKPYLLCPKNYFGYNLESELVIKS